MSNQLLKLKEYIETVLSDYDIVIATQVNDL